jgi:hypothetical protein
MSATNIETESSFDLFRLSKGKRAVDICPNTLRKFNEDGLPFYRRGSAVFVSKADLASFLRSPLRRTTR